MAPALSTVPTDFSSYEGVTSTSVGSKSPSAPCAVTDLIRYQVDTNPHATAVHVENEEPVTYVILWKLILQLIASRVFKPGTIVPVCMDPSVEFVATLLAILEAGAAYIILDPESSAARNRLIVEDSGAGEVVAHPQYASAFTRSITVEKILSIGSVENPFHKRTPASSSDLAYIIYTSG